MRALASATVAHGGMIARSAAQAPQPAWKVAVTRRPRPVYAARTCSVFASSGNGAAASSASSTASSSTGWLLEPTSSCLDTASSRSQGYDAIMMLGGGLLPGGGLPEWVVRRLEGCLYLYRQQQQQQLLSQQQAAGGNGSSARGPYAPTVCPIVLLGAGTPHKPPVIDGGGHVLHESTAYADFLLRHGVPAGDLLKEAQSYDTVGNAYFSLLQHALPAGWRRIAVVTSAFHMPRTAATFDFVYRLAGRQLHGDSAWFQLDYLPVSDEGLFDPEVLSVRAEKEAAAVAAWQRNTAGMHSLADLHAWLYATHLCYSVGRQHEFGRERDLDPKLAATY